MTASDTPNSVTEQKLAERLDVAHARAVQDADRVFTLCDIRGRLILRHDLRPNDCHPVPCEQIEKLREGWLWRDAATKQRHWFPNDRLKASHEEPEKAGSGSSAPVKEEYVS